MSCYDESHPELISRYTHDNQRLRHDVDKNQNLDGLSSTSTLF